MLSFKDKTVEQNSISNATTQLRLTSNQAITRMCASNKTPQKLMVSESTLKSEKEIKSPFKKLPMVPAPAAPYIHK